MNTPTSSSKPNPFLWIIAIPCTLIALTFWALMAGKNVSPPAPKPIEKVALATAPIAQSPMLRMPGNGNLYLFCYNKGDTPPTLPVVGVYLYGISDDIVLNRELIRLREEMQKKIWELGGTDDYAQISKAIQSDVIKMLEKSATRKARLEFPRIREGMFIFR